MRHDQPRPSHEALASRVVAVKRLVTGAAVVGFAAFAGLAATSGHAASKASPAHSTSQQPSVESTWSPFGDQQPTMDPVAGTHAS